MQLRQAEAIRVHDDHKRRVRHVYADLNDGRRNEQLHLVIVERAHHLVLLGRSHPPVQQPDLEVRKSLLHRYVQIDGILHIQLVGFLDQRTDQISLPSCGYLALDEPKHPIHHMMLHPIGRNRLTPLRPLGQRRYVHIAKGGNRQRPGNRRRRHRQHVRIKALASQNTALIYPEPMLLVRHDQTERAKEDVLLNKRMGTDDDIRQPHLH
ncbi:hypothetical protein D3C77_484840 [compost metagenome]